MADESDVERMAEGYLRGLEVAGRPPSGDVRDTVRAEAYSLPHVVGTCAMGAVVDATGRVHGTEGLTVADASIIPDALSAFTHIPVIMLAERIAEAIGSSR